MKVQLKKVYMKVNCDDNGKFVKKKKSHVMEVRKRIRLEYNRNDILLSKWVSSIHIYVVQIRRFVESIY